MDKIYVKHNPLQNLKPTLLVHKHSDKGYSPYTFIIIPCLDPQSLYLNKLPLNNHQGEF
jgi:hypothetical protein